MSWVEEFRPRRFEDVKGQNEAINRIISFVGTFRKGKKALVLHGPPGVGKTTLAHVIAIENDSELFELNASDLRNREKLKGILKPAIEQKSLTKDKKIILVDEVDGISEADWGGLTELLNLMDGTTYPIIMTANDIWNRKFSNLRRKSELIQLRDVDYRTIKVVLTGILKKKDMSVGDDILTSVAMKSKGDLRAAINDLETISGVGSSGVMTDERNRETDIFKSLRSVFKEEPSEKTLSLYDSVKMPIDEIILWVEENIPLEYRGEALAKAYRSLSNVDLFKGRIYKKQYWRFLVYENIFLSYGIASSKKKAGAGFTNYRKPTRILKIWMNNQKTAKKKTIAKKYARHVHVGERRAMNEFDFIKLFIKGNPKIQEELKLDEDELEYLKKSV